MIKVCKQKEILKLHVLGYRAEDISEITGIKKNTVFSKVRIMKERLRRYR
jgi:DNA-binding CsgD family transcriptional regulator